MATKSVPARDFTVGWVCALPVELAAAVQMMDEKFADLPSHPADSNLYSFGRIGVHNVVAACLPAGQHSGVVQYDFGKTGPDGRIARTGSLIMPPYDSSERPG